MKYTFKNSPRRSGARAAGFTLVELLVSMLILAIGIMATLGMQFTALGGAMLSRDNSNASDIAEQVFNVMRVESQQWRRGSIANDVNTAVFDPANSSWAASPVLAEVEGATPEWGWVRLFESPVDARLSNRGVTRYCAYARGAYLDPMDPEVFRTQLAVVYPSANNAFPAAGCTEFTSTDLDASLEPDDPASLQMKGFRVQYFGTQIVRRGFLAL